MTLPERTAAVGRNAINALAAKRRAGKCRRKVPSPKPTQILTSTIYRRWLGRGSDAVTQEHHRAIAALGTLYVMVNKHALTCTQSGSHVGCKVLRAPWGRAPHVLMAKPGGSCVLVLIHSSTHGVCSIAKDSCSASSAEKRCHVAFGVPVRLCVLVDQATTWRL